jgi:hypothetical protein
VCQTYPSERTLIGRIVKDDGADTTTTRLVDNDAEGLDNASNRPYLRWS